jgi:hypothetical protein
LVKSLIEKSGKAGINELSFNTESLENGKYFIVVNDGNGRKLLSTPFIILK